ncbi:MAG: ABC transporter permease [Candidatus Bathyarchaeia archaeon]
MPNQPPNDEHPLGTDGFGRDVLSQIFIGTISSFQIGFTAALISTILGTFIGFFAGYIGGYFDSFLKGLTDIFLVIPMLPVLVVISAVFKNIDIWTMSLIIAAWAWASPARNIRAQTLTLKERDFIVIAKLSGLSDKRIVVEEIMPHMISWIIGCFVNNTLRAILMEASLELLGLGPKTIPTLGMMIYWAMSRQAMYKGLWWWWSSPIVLLIISFNALILLHSGISEISNPRLRRGAKSFVRETS